MNKYLNTLWNKIFHFLKLHHNSTKQWYQYIFLAIYIDIAKCPILIFFVTVSGLYLNNFFGQSQFQQRLAQILEKKK